MERRQSSETGRINQAARLKIDDSTTTGVAYKKKKEQNDTFRWQAIEQTRKAKLARITRMRQGQSSPARLVAGGVELAHVACGAQGRRGRPGAGACVVGA